MGVKINFLLIVFLAFILRVYKIDTIPGALNRDEASIGYNAYLILKTGKDEHGKFLPFYFESFGDWKMPTYIYLTVPSVAIFGLNEFAVRLPSALAGTLTVFIVYFLTKELFSKSAYHQLLITHYLPEIASLLLAVSPWHIHFSRQAYEVNLALCFLSAGSFLFLKEKYLPAFLLFVLTTFTYHGVILLSLLIFSYLVFLKKEKRSFSKKPNFYVLFFVLIIIVSQFFQKGAVKDKFWQSAVFQNSAVFLERVSLVKSIHKQGGLIVRIFHNRIAEGVLEYFENYSQSLSLSFLFFGNDKNARFLINKKSLRLNIGILLPFYLLGLFLIIKRKKREELFWLAWYLAVPILPSFLVRTPSSFRNLPEVIPLMVFSALGFCYFLTLLKNQKIKKLFCFLIIFVFMIDLVKIGEEYIFHLGGGFDQHYKQIVKNFDYFEKKKEKPLLFNASRSDLSPYIFLAFYKKIDPSWFLSNIKWYNKDAEGFKHAESLSPKYQFGTINWGKPIERDVVYVEFYNSIPGEVKELGGIDKKIIKNKIGEPVFFEFVY